MCGFHRSRENSRPFTIACFEEEEEDEEGVKGEQDYLDSTNLDTSDYHSATSSDCGSTTSSDTEEEAKDGETEGEQEKENKNVVKKEAAEGDTYTVVMVPRIRKRNDEGPNKVKFVRNMVIYLLLFLNTICWYLTIKEKAWQYYSIYFLLSANHMTRAKPAMNSTAYSFVP